MVIAGLFFGVLLALGLGSLYVAVTVRDRSASWFVGFVGALIVHGLVLAGHGNDYLVLATEILSFVTFLGFTRSFLQTRSAAPAWDRALLAAFAVIVIGDVARHAFSASQILTVGAFVARLAAVAITIGAGITRARAGYQPARFFVLAFVPAVIGNWGFAENGMGFGAMAECLILSFGLLDRMRILDRERLKAQAELARTAQRNTELKTLATRDPLTGIDNRLAFFEKFEDEIEYARRTGLLIGVLYIDLDDFKVVNDRYGHRVGDILLQIFSRRLKNAVRPSDTVARLGGDEFAVLANGLGDAGILDSVKINVEHILDTPIVVDGALVTVGMSIGTAIYPRDGEEADALIESADRRMYHAKHAGAQAPAGEG